VTAIFTPKLRKLLFGISAAETLVATRGFTVSNPAVKTRIEQIGSSFVEGYHAALLDNNPVSLAVTLNASPLEQRGFVFEGAAMGLVICDFLAPWRQSRWQAFLQGPGAAHTYMLHVGAGWAMARLPGFGGMLKNLDPLLRWLVLDGYGFHEGYFHSNKSIVSQIYPNSISGYGYCAFDQGLGRSFWFVYGADAQRIASIINDFPLSRRKALWSGVGLAAAYAGGVAVADLQTLAELADQYQPQLAQGAAFAAKARQLASNPAEHTQNACRIFCRTTADVAAGITDQALLDLPFDDSTLPAYEYWRQRIQASFSE